MNHTCTPVNKDLGRGEGGEEGTKAWVDQNKSSKWDKICCLNSNSPTNGTFLSKTLNFHPKTNLSLFINIRNVSKYYHKRLRWESLCSLLEATDMPMGKGWVQAWGLHGWEVSSLPTPTFTYFTYIFNQVIPTASLHVFFMGCQGEIPYLCLTFLPILHENVKKFWLQIYSNYPTFYLNYLCYFHLCQYEISIFPTFCRHTFVRIYGTIQILIH